MKRLSNTEVKEDAQSMGSSFIFAVGRVVNGKAIITKRCDIYETRKVVSKTFS